MFKAVTPAQAILLDTAQKFLRLLNEAQADKPRQARDLHLHEQWGAPFLAARTLLAPLGIAPEFGALSAMKVQEKLDGAVTPGQALTFFEALPWETFKPAGGRNVLTPQPDSDFHAFMIRLGYASDSGIHGLLHTYPTFHPFTPDPIWHALMAATAQAGVQVIGRLEFSRAEEEDLIQHAGVTYFAERGDFYPVTRTDDVRTRYTDADDRPGERPADGNGWRERVRVYQAAPAVQDAALRQALVDAADLRVALGDFVAGYLDTLTPEERRSREQAELARYRAYLAGEFMVVQRTQCGLWEAVNGATNGSEKAQTDWETL